MNIEKLTDAVMNQMGWNESDNGVRNTVRVAIKATLAFDPEPNADKDDVASIMTLYAE